MNTRVLVVDDEESIRESFRLALSTNDPVESKSADAASALFGEENSPTNVGVQRIHFEIDYALNGRDGYERVEQAVKEGNPYAAVFCDMRMPGWDGLETVEHIRNVDQRCEVLFVTAYSDHSVQTITGKIGANVGYFLKPFASEEILQTATKAVIDWNKARELESLMNTVSGLRGDRSQMEGLLSYLLKQFCSWLEIESGALVRVDSDGAPEFKVGVGDFNDQDKALRVFRQFASSEFQVGAVEANDCIYMPIGEYGIAIGLSSKIKLTPDREYLVRVFLEQAALAIENCEAHERLRVQERMSAIGSALGHVLHDIRAPLRHIKMMIEFLKEDGTSVFSPDEVFERIPKSIRECESLITSVLEFSRGENHLCKETTQLKDFVESTLSVVTLELKSKGIVLKTDVQKDLSANVDVDRFSRCLTNLVNNAAEALSRSEDAKIVVSGRGSEQECVIEVADNGPGISEKIRSRLFQPFATFGKVNGTGFGLAITKEIIEAHGGRIDFETGESGTVFRIFIPTAEMASKNEAA